MWEGFFNFVDSAEPLLDALNGGTLYSAGHDLACSGPTAIGHLSRVAGVLYARARRQHAARNADTEIVGAFLKAYLESRRGLRCPDGWSVERQLRPDLWFAVLAGGNPDLFRLAFGTLCHGLAWADVARVTNAWMRAVESAWDAHPTLPVDERLATALGEANNGVVVFPSSLELNPGYEVSLQTLLRQTVSNPGERYLVSRVVGRFTDGTNRLLVEYVDYEDAPTIVTLTPALVETQKVVRHFVAATHIHVPSTALAA
ncbi:hypothetical protein J8273_2237 [Carpediemonas membranifera]|uniref:Uncharacterized protein n=1 Tax=Carpediemonas membranifera TaxID=201153 RepID=A0A8J6E5K8_9EUKA|nr:hypothetical protein J8273_2237 [Carpediemonas membranifera]|eukprot:KAG9395902.1 hypothetical protein J8273_2237 [Carpediemonas membranifera]